MEVNNDSKRLNGIFYTPPELAEYLVEPLLTERGLKILDPAYGEGSLLLAAEKVDKQKKGGAALSLHGCDTKPVNGLLQHLPQANLRKADFFEFSTANKFDVILMNPPYVRHHFQDNGLIDKYRAKYPDLSMLNMKADLWAYFLVKAVLHLNHDGDIGAILPWSFLQAEYSRGIRGWLSTSFREIHLLGLSEKYFEHAEARIVLLWLKGYGYPSSKIKLGMARSLTEKVHYSKVAREQWASENVLQLGNYNSKTLLNSFKSKYGFFELGDVCNIRIGVVTGADDLFLLDNAGVKRFRILSRHLVPIMSNSKEFNAILNDKIDILRKLVVINERHAARYSEFIRHGRRMKFHLRAHSRRRTPWFAVVAGETPDCFFPYRISKIPFMLNNDYGIQCTNSVHRLYFKDVSPVELKWIQVSLMSTIAQLSLECGSKTYGKGMLKVEPSSLKKALVIKRTDRSIEAIHAAIYEKLKEGKKTLAVELADSFIYPYLGIDDSDSRAARTVLASFYNFRLKS